MDWLYSCGGAPSLTLLPLGTYCNNQYYISDQCLLCLEDLVKQLDCDDPNTYSRRRGLGYIDILNKDLKPILMSCCRNWPQVFRSTVRLLVRITTPVECVLYDRTPNLRSNSSNVTKELTQLLSNAKESLSDGNVTRAIIEHAKHLLSKQPLSSKKIEFLNESLLLIRNILEAPERPVEPDLLSLSYSKGDNYEFEHRSQQNKIMRNLFGQEFDKLLLDMMASLAFPEKDGWVVTIIQVIAAMYKNRRVEDIQAYLKITITSDTVVSFDNDGKNMPLSNSTNSDDRQEVTDEQRWKTNIQKLDDTLRKHFSNERAISQLLANFTIDFMQNGFCVILKRLPQQLKQKDNHLVDKSHFLWLLVNFLPFTPQLEQKSYFLKEVLTTDLMCYLIWVVVEETEHVQLNSINAGVDPKPSLRRLRLGVRAIFEYLQALEKYSLIESDGGKNNFFHCDEDWIFHLRQRLSAMNQLRQLFLLLLLHFNKEIQSDQCLFDIICANHALLLTLERATQQPRYRTSFDADHHLIQFCTSTIMARYGSALEDFKTNDYFVNESIFAMLRRVGCELGRLDLLCQPIVLRPLCKIWEEEFEISCEWHDLIECLIRKFTGNLLNHCTMVSLHTDERRSQDEVNFQLMKADQQLFEEEFASKYDALTEANEKITSLIRQLTNAGFNKQLDWIQSSLLTACAVRLGTYAGQEFRYSVCCLCVAMEIPCPIVPWTELEAFGLRSERFRFLLQLMGLIPRFSQFFFYPKIPSEWSADVLYSVALLFGPIPDHVDFDLTLVKEVHLPILPLF